MQIFADFIGIRDAKSAEALCEGGYVGFFYHEGVDDLNEVKKRPLSNYW